MTQKVFFLGAGFSKAVNNNYPLMDDLTDKVLSRLEKKSVREHLNEIPPQVKKNIESLLTYLSTDFPWKTDTTRYSNKALYSAILHEISALFLELETSDEYTHNYKPSDVIVSFAKHVLQTPKEYNFLTLNYDIFLEHLFAVASQWKADYNDLYKYPMSNLRARIIDSSSITIRFPYPQAPAVLKLHGSANWFWAKTNPSDDIYFSNGTEKDFANLVMGLEPYIIPPALDKNAFYNHIAIRSLWQQAEALLKKADEIYIIGFSFPQTDLSVRYLFQSALRTSEPDIYVVNNAQEEKLRPTYQDVLQGQCVDYEYTGSDNVVERFIREVILMEGHQ